MRVLIVGPSLSAKGGVALYYSTVYPYLRESQDVRVEYLQIGVGSGRNQFFAFLNFLFKLVLSKPNIVHVNTSVNWKGFIRDGIYLGCARLVGCKTIVFFRGWSLPDEVTGGLLFQLYFKLFYKRAAAFCVLANEVSARLRSWRVPGKIFKLSTVVDRKLLEFECPRNNLDSGGVKYTVVFLGRVEERKGIFDLIEATYLLIKKGRSIRVIVAGEGSKLREARDLADSLGIAQHIEFVGFLEGKDKAEVLSQSDLFCLPSYTEGMPNAVLEAMCFGLPIISCPVGALKDLVDDEVGVLVNPGDVVALSRSIEKYIDDPCFREISEMISTNARNLYSSDKVSAKLLSVYRDVA